MNVTVEPLTDLSSDPAVRGFLHQPAQASGDSLVLTHGAGSDCESKLILAVASAFAAAGVTVLRCNLPFRQERPQGPPVSARADCDREGLKRAVNVLKARTKGGVYLGGHSYGGRQSTLLGADDPGLVSGLLLLSYPLHPPRKPTELRTTHFSSLRLPSLFVHGTRDPFGSIAEMKAALELIPGPAKLLDIEGAGHELLSKKDPTDLPGKIYAAFSQHVVLTD